MNKEMRTLGAVALMSAVVTCGLEFGLSGSAWSERFAAASVQDNRQEDEEARPESEVIPKELLGDRLPWPGRIRRYGGENSYLTTMYALDPSSSCIRLTDGDSGRGVFGNWPENLGGHLNFGGLMKDGFGIAYQDWQLGTILDLGHHTKLHPKQAEYEEVGSFIGFASLNRWSDGATYTNAVHIHDGTEPYGVTDLEGMGDLWNPTGEKETSQVKLGHVYLIRIVHELEDMREIVMVKALVVDHTPDVSVTFRWMHL